MLRHHGVASIPFLWNLIVLMFLAKNTWPELFKHFRGIALLDCASTLFVCALLNHVQRHMRKNICCHFLCIAYTKGRSCIDVILFLNSFLGNTYEWRPSAVIRDSDLECCICSRDILGAFDNCKITSVAEAMKAAGNCAKSIATHLELQVDLTLRPEFHQVQVPN